MALAMESNLPTWSSDEFVAEWVAQDLLADMFTLPRQISAAIVADAGVPVSHVLDLGAGAGAHLETMLRTFPRARGTWIDTSPKMEEIARDELADLGDRVDFHVGDMEQLEALAPDPAEVVLTARVVHHFSPESIRSLYRVIYDLVEPGGFFFNLDHYGSPDGWEPRYRRIRRQFTGPRKQDLPPHRHDFPFTPIPFHLEWLEEAGFQPPDVPWRTFYTALIAAQKPA